jgi:5-methylcytosine-specific restriction endonuclease McrA
MGKRVHNWSEVQSFYDQGNSFRECRMRFGFTTPAWVKAVAAGRLRVHESDLRGRRGFRGKTTYNWPLIQAFYDEGRSYEDCRLRFGFSSTTWYKAKQRGELRTRPREWPVHKVLAQSRSRLTIKRTLLKAGLLENRCEECGLTQWRGRPISIQIDHRNGIRHDHRLENLRMLCPNCHSQTETFAARNVQRRNRSRVV